MSQHIKTLFLAYTAILVFHIQPTVFLGHHLSCSPTSLWFRELAWFGGGWGNYENYKWETFY